MNKIKANIPVIVTPSDINFYLDSRKSYKQLLTIYNPYDFTIKFKILCSAPEKFTIYDPEGTVRPNYCVDIIIIFNKPNKENCGIKDKFKINMYDNDSKQLLGKRIITSCLLTGEPSIDSLESFENFQPMPQKEVPQSVDKLEQRKISQGNLNCNINKSQTNPFCIFAGVICILVLFMPTYPVEHDSNTKIPKYLHVTVNIKLIFSFVLGLIFMAAIKP